MPKRRILKVMKLIKRLLLLFLLLFLGGILGGVGYYYAVTKDAKLSPSLLTVNEKTVVLYDYQGEAAQGACASFFKQTVAVDRLPDHLKSAFISTEDKRFYSHKGYDIRGILRASWNNLKTLSFKEGASTISQQLIKNSHLTQEKTIKRKLKEWKLTKELEKRYSKEEILEKYLNGIYFGHSCFGIASASEFYFGKTPDKLTVGESALLAGLVKSPNNYSPFSHPEKCEKRKRVVLALMLENGAITQKEREEALLEPLPVQTHRKSANGYAHFVFDELSSLSEKYSFKIGGQIEIYTYLDQALQKEVEEIADGYTASDKTLLVLNNADRGYKACVSTVRNIPRLPGSLLKPLLVYAPAVEENLLSPATPILDEKVNYHGYAPENYDGKYHGYVSVRECLEKSLNIPAVKVLEALTIDKGASYLARMGLPVEKEDRSLALALGGMRTGYSLQDLLSAYATLPNQGVYGECGFISAVKINGATVYSKSNATQRVFAEDTAYLVSDMLRTTAQKGTAKKLRSLPVEIAAKTGTAGSKKGNTDAYALSFTASDSAGVWLGNADNTPVQTTGGGEPCNLLFQINRAVIANYAQNGVAIPPLPVCENVRKVELDKTAYYDTHTLSRADELSPESYRFSELFRSSAIPLSKSDCFTNPTVLPPTLSLQNNQVVIRLDPRSPKYYQYRIDRYDYATHTTLYDGDFKEVIVDEQLEENKNYLYTLIPHFEDRRGNPIPLPIVTTKAGEPPKLTDGEILSKEWWKE